MRAIKKTEEMNITTKVKRNEDGSCDVVVNMTPAVVAWIKEGSPDVNDKELELLLVAQAKSELLLESFKGIENNAHFFQRCFAHYVTDAGNMQYVLENLKLAMQEVH